MPLPREPTFAALALRSGDFVFSPCAGCGGSRMANFQLTMCAMCEWDAGVAGGDLCLFFEIRTGQCRNLGGVAAQRSAVAAKMERFARVGRVCKMKSYHSCVHGMSVEFRHRSESIPKTLYRAPLRILGPAALILGLLSDVKISRPTPYHNPPEPSQYLRGRSDGNATSPLAARSHSGFRCCARGTRQVHAAHCALFRDVLPSFVRGRQVVS